MKWQFKNSKKAFAYQWQKLERLKADVGKNSEQAALPVAKDLQV